MIKKPNMNNRKPATKQSARHIAITILHQCADLTHTIDFWLDRFSVQIESLNRPDRALLHALVFGVLRWQKRLDWILDHLASRPGKKIDALVRVVLRVGLFQIVYLDRIPSSAAVNTAVEWVKLNNRSWATGFVNSVLRRATTQADRISWPDENKDRVTAIAIQHSFPRWLIKQWITRRGVEETQLLCQAINTVAPLTLRTNTLKTTRTKIMASIANSADQIEATSYAPEGIRFTSPAKPVTQWPLFSQGGFQIQDEAAQIIAHLLAPQPGQRVWDACAGLGTKTAHIAQLMENRGLILSTDISKKKLGKLESEMDRLSIAIVDTHAMDLAVERPPQTHFDRILVDAPCSGLGVLQKNPDGKWRSHPEDLKQSGQRQLLFLERAITHLAPDGLLLYAVCSTETEENEAVIDRFLQKHQEFAIHTPEPSNVQNLDALITVDGYFKTLPHRHHMDGFFAAIIKKQP